MRPSIDIIPKEQVVSIGEFSSHFEYLEHIEELSMDISNYRDGEGDSLHIFLLY